MNKIVQQTIDKATAVNTKTVDRRLRDYLKHLSMIKRTQLEEHAK